MEDRLCKYWQSQLKRAAKLMPVEAWEKAEKRLSVKEKDDEGKDVLPVVNEFRNFFENSRAYIDQREANFKVAPSPAKSSDENIIKRAECEQKYLQYVWHEQRVQKAQSKKLNSALVRNVGFTFPTFDLKKWMPTVKYIPARKVRFDPDCDGNYEEANWCAYYECLPADEVKTKYDLSDDQMKLIHDKGQSALTEKEQGEIGEKDSEQFALATVWHIFAKNSSAVRRFRDSETEVPSSLADELEISTPKKYIVLIEGLQDVVVNNDKWPFELDHNENALTPLQMNKELETLYGYTDFQQMERMDKVTDAVMGFIEEDAYYSACRKYAGGEDMPDEKQIKDWLENPRRTYLDGLLGEDGKPKIQELRVGQINPHMAPHYELMSKEAAKSSGLNELLADTIADLKDVTAIGVRYQQSQLHQRVNLRLGGPDGFEVSCQEDAVKILEIAHQLVPVLSKVSVTKPVETFGENGEKYLEIKEVVEDLPWPAAQQAMVAGGKLLALGVDAVVGEELAKYWVTTDTVPLEEIRLSTDVMIVPGSTRTITSEQKAAEMVDLYANVLFPTLYQPLGLYGYAARFVEHILQLRGEDRAEDFIPRQEEIQAALQQMQQAQQQAVQQDTDAEEQKQQLEIEKKSAEAEIDLEKKKTEAELDAQKSVMQMERDQTNADLQLQVQRMRSQERKVPAHAR